MIVTNRGKQCLVVVETENRDVTEKGLQPADVRKITIQRKDLDSNTWVDLYERIVVAGILAFEVLDWTALSRRGYTYRSKIETSSQTVYTDGVYIYADFKGIMVAKEGAAYICLIEPRAQVDRYYNAAYVKPYYSRYPHFIMNGDTNYDSGTVEGKFNRFDGACGIMAETGKYAKKVADFLSDGSAKLIKTHDGYGWWATINEKITSQIDEVGLLNVNFEWTEIGAVPGKASEAVEINGGVASYGYAMQSSVTQNVLQNSVMFTLSNGTPLNVQNPNVFAQEGASDNINLVVDTPESHMST